MIDPAGSVNLCISSQSLFSIMRYAHPSSLAFINTWAQASIILFPCVVLGTVPFKISENSIMVVKPIVNKCFQCRTSTGCLVNCHNISRKASDTAWRKNLQYGRHWPMCSCAECNAAPNAGVYRAPPSSMWSLPATTCSHENGEQHRHQVIVGPEHLVIPVRPQLPYQAASTLPRDQIQ
jgi:hypothetical protein